MFTFIDLFAGIGGFRLGLEKLGGKCVLTCEKDKFARETYKANFKIDHIFHNDIITLDANIIPKHDILCAGFPCQSFSIAGIAPYKHLKKNSGFDAPDKGLLFFELVRIISQCKPKVFILENVKHLLNHDFGKTFETIRIFLEKYLKYNVQFRVINAKHFVPQNRDRVFIVGFIEKVDFDINSFILPSVNLKISDILDNSPSEKYTITDSKLKLIKNHKAKHKAKGNGFGYKIADVDKPARTLLSRYYNCGTAEFIDQKDENPRYFTTLECKRLMGFPDNFVMPVSISQSYKQLGNAVVPDVVEWLMTQILTKMHL